MNPLFPALLSPAAAQQAFGVNINRMVVVDGDTQAFAAGAYVRFDDVAGVSTYKIVKGAGNELIKPVSFSYLSGVDRGAVPTIYPECKIQVFGLSAGDGSGVNNMDGYAMLMSGQVLYLAFGSDPIPLESFKSELSADGTATLILSNDGDCDPLVGNSLGIWDGTGKMDFTGVDFNNPVFVSGYKANGMIPYQNLIWLNRNIFFHSGSLWGELAVDACPLGFWFCNTFQGCDMPFNDICGFPES